MASGRQCPTMRIAYVAPYQGPALVKTRPSLHNLSLAGRVKVQLIAELLHDLGHEVEVISQGPVDRRQLRFYPGFLDPQPFHPDIPVTYLSALPIRYLTALWESWRVRRLLRARHSARPFDLAIIYNLKAAQLECARLAATELRIPVVLEYEDDSFSDVRGRQDHGALSGWRGRRLRNALASLSGAMAPSPVLLDQCPASVPKLLIRAVVNREILRLRDAQWPKQKWVAFSGTLENAQGLMQTVAAWRQIQPDGWQLHIAGQGPLEADLRNEAAGDPSIVFHGLLDRAANARLLCSATIGLNPQDVTAVPGNTFAFKIVEYLAAGAHVVTTPRGPVEPELEAGITYIPDNSPTTLVACLRQLLTGGAPAPALARAEMAARQIYGPAQLSAALRSLLNGTIAKTAAAQKVTAHV